MNIATALISIITNAPQLLSEATALYNAVRASLSTEDQATIDELLASAITTDAAATAKADAALDAAAQR